MFSSMMKSVSDAAASASAKAAEHVAAVQRSAGVLTANVDTPPNSQPDGSTAPSSDSSVAVNSSGNAESTSSSAQKGKATYCGNCNAELTFTESIQAYVSSSKCRVCARIFCSKCSKAHIAKSTVPIPFSLIHADFVDKSQANKQQVDQYAPICSECNPNIIAIVMDMFQKEMNAKFEKNFNDFLSVPKEAYQAKGYFPIPTSVPEDTTYRQALRVAQIAEKVVDFTGFSLTLKALKYAYYSSELINYLIKNDLFALLSPLLETLKGYGITGPTALLKLYYLGCQHTLRSMQDTLSRHTLYTRDQRGVLFPTAPSLLLHYVARYLSPSQWQYISVLPEPYNDNEWSSWYLQSLLTRQGWTLLQCMNDTTKLPNSLKCPAFAIVAREIHHKKEALVVVRGSQSSMDWSINFQENLVDYVYHHLTLNATPQCYNETKGHVHKGIYEGAMGILDGYNARHYILSLLESGFDVKFVGHSLGAGVAVMMAMEVRKTLLITRYDTTTTAVTNPVVACKLDKVNAIVFSCPAFLSLNLANVLLLDRLLVNVIHDADGIPRFNHKNLTKLAQEIEEFTGTASDWQAEDKYDLQRYVSHLGRAAEIHRSTPHNRRIRRQKMREMKEKMILEEKQREEEAKKESFASKMGKQADAAWRNVLNFSLTSNKKEGNDASNATSEDAANGMEMTSIVDILIDPMLPQEEEKVIMPTAPPPPKKPSRKGSATNTVTYSNSGSMLPTPSAPPLEEGIVVQGVAVPTAVIVDTPPIISVDSVEDITMEKKMLSFQDIDTVTPGPILHLYRDTNLSYRCSVVSFDHIAFDRFELFPMRMLSDHDIVTYRSVLDRLRYTMNSVEKLSEEERKEMETFLPFDILDNGVVEEEVYHDTIAQVPNTSVSASNASNASWQPLSLHIDNPPQPLTRQSSTASYLSAIEGQEEGGHRSSESSNTSSNNNSSEGYDEWIGCCVCGLDVTWPYLTHSDASRATCTHHCYACGRIVCTYCAPAGDIVQGEGVNKTVTLPDLRLALPMRGIFQPQRVCLHCYFDSSYPGLGKSNV